MQGHPVIHHSLPHSGENHGHPGRTDRFLLWPVAGKKDATNSKRAEDPRLLVQARTLLTRGAPGLTTRNKKLLGAMHVLLVAKFLSLHKKITGCFSRLSSVQAYSRILCNSPSKTMPQRRVCVISYVFLCDRVCYDYDPMSIRK